MDEAALNPYQVFDDMFEGVQVIDFETRYVYLNKAALSQGKNTLENLRGRRMQDMYPGIEKMELFELIQLCLKDRKPRSITNLFTFPDGSQGWFDLRINAVPAGALILSVDISEQKAYEAQVREAQKMEAIGRLAGGIAHDFNNIINIVSGHATILMEELEDKSEGWESASEILKASERAERLTRQILAFGRKQMLHPEVIDFNQILDHMAKMLERMIGENIELKVAKGEGLGAVYADPGQMEQIIMNLALNARDAMPQGGKLTLETSNVDLGADYVGMHLYSAPGQHVMLAVTDTGVGMDSSTKARIFEPFFSTKSLGRGTGLGLATVFGIVKQSGGNVWVYSEPGRGSCFKIYLPRHFGEAKAPVEEARNPALPKGQGTVLLVEDEAELCALFKKVLEASGYEVIAARSGEEAMKLARAYSGRIDLLLTDVIMPGIDGGKLAEAMTALRPGLKVLYMSGYTDQIVLGTGSTGKTLNFVEKPVSPHALVRKIQSLIS